LSNNNDLDTSGECVDSKVESKYFDRDSFKSFSSLSSNQLSLFHVNITSSPKHINELTALLNDLNHTFKILAISETGLIKSGNNLNDLKIPGYSSRNTEAEAAAGGTGLYINQSLAYKIRDDLSIKCHLSKQLESTFAEISLPNQPNIIVGCIYKHPTLPINELMNLANIFYCLY